MFTLRRAVIGSDCIGGAPQLGASFPCFIRPGQGAAELDDSDCEKACAFVEVAWRHALKGAQRMPREIVKDSGRSNRLVALSTYFSTFPLFHFSTYLNQS